VILLGDIYVPGAQDINGVALTQQSLVWHLGDWSQYFLTGAILLFAFSSIIYNYYLGENALTVLTHHPASLHIFRFALMGIVFLGAAAPAATSIFFFSDPMMGILAIVNLLALLMLFPIAKRLIVDFAAQLKAGIDRPVLDPEKYSDLDIDHNAWPGIETRTKAGE
jgi:AGCS family alanine or glycine:cation symporter